MALTPQQEAQVLQLLDQQAALLSLANNEGLISSKLGAQKVNISQLPAASTLAPADLLVVRQGTQDKSANVALITSTASGGSLLSANNLSDVANPATARTNIGAAAALNATLTGNPVAPTALQFDNDTSIATTEFVRRSGFGYSGEQIVTSGTATLDNTAAGKLIVFSLTANGAATLPLANTFPAGSTISFYCATAGSFVGSVNRSGTDVISGNNTTITTVPLADGETLVLESNGSNTWRVVGGSAQLAYSSKLRSTVATGGSSITIGSTIFKWGTADLAGASTINVVFTEPFPNACLAAFTTDSETVPSSICYGGTTFNATSINLTYAKNGAAANPAIVYWFAIGK